MKDITVNLNPKKGKKLINSDKNNQKERKIKEKKNQKTYDGKKK